MLGVSLKLSKSSAAQRAAVRQYLCRFVSFCTSKASKLSTNEVAAHFERFVEELFLEFELPVQKFGGNRCHMSPL